MNAEAYLERRPAAQIESWAERGRRAKRMNDALVLGALSMAKETPVPVALTARAPGRRFS